MSAWTKEQLEEMLFAVVDELQLSDAALEMHGPRGTEPHLLVRAVLAEKDGVIRNLKAGMVDVSEVARLREELRMALIERDEARALCELAEFTAERFEEHAKQAEQREREALAALVEMDKEIAHALTYSITHEYKRSTRLEALLSRAREQEVKS